MRSIKKIALLVAAAAAVVAVVAPAANATVLQNSKGETLPKGSKFSMTSNGAWTFETSWGKLNCKQVSLPSELNAPVGETLKAVGVGPGSASTCNFGSGNFTLEPELRGMSLTSPLSGTMDLKMTAWYPGFINPCVYENTATPVTYTSGGSVLRISGVYMKANGACGPFRVTGELTLKDSVGNLLFLK